MNYILLKGLLGDMNNRVALVVAPLLPWIHTGVGTLGSKYDKSI